MAKNPNSFVSTSLKGTITRIVVVHGASRTLKDKATVLNMVVDGAHMDQISYLIMLFVRLASMNIFMMQARCRTGQTLWRPPRNHLNATQRPYSVEDAAGGIDKNGDED
jgi:hypothetical protein